MEIGTNMTRKLTKILREKPVLLAYVFGSSVGGQEVSKSDVDVAVFLTEGLTKQKRFEVRLTLIGQLSKIFRKDVDLVVMNDIASLFFKYIIIKEGRLVYSRSELERIDFENRVLGLYFDFQPFLDTYNQNYVKSGI